MSDIRIEQRWFDFLNRKYVQRSDARQKSMGLQYMEAETHDLARECARFEASLHPSSADIPAKAREMLAEEYERNGMRIEAKALLQAGPCSLDEVCALSVIERALTLSRPALDREAVARVICQSDRFDTGEGTCAVLCMEFLGSPRKKGCGHAARVHGKLADAILSLLSDQSGSSLTPEEAWQDLVEKDDRTSPEECADMALITFQELADYMRSAATPPQAGEPA